MKFLRGLDFALAAFATTMAVTLGVVCVMYAVYLDESPRMREEWPALTEVTAMFAVLALAASAAFFSLRRESRWRWPAQALMVAVIAGIALSLRSVLLP